MTGIRILSALLLYTPLLSIGQHNYAVKDIPDTLLHNANAVVRYDSKTVDIQSTTDVTITKHIIITILNKKANVHGEVTIGYRKGMSKINNIKGFIYDRKGEKIDKLKKSDIGDWPLINGSFADDIRFKRFSLEHEDYPYTIEYKYSKTKNFLFGGSEWYPQNYYNLSIEFSQFEISVPDEVGLRYKLFNIDEPKIQFITNGKKYYWELSMFHAVDKEPYSPSDKLYDPVVKTAPNKFNYDGYPGEMDSWDKFINWVQNLNDLVGPLPEAKQDEIIKLTSNIPDKRDKIKAVYQYLQGNTRYISIQLGIGGFKPLDPAFVAEKGYGECKALTFYTKSLLKALNIDSYYTLVNAGKFEDDIMLDFPSSQFNHAFLCVPVEKDTVWLECTSQDNPFGYVGSFTGSRNVLVLDGNGGGKFVKTPSYKNSSGNQVNTGANVVVDESGAARVSAKTVYRGLGYEDVRHLLDRPRRDREDWLYKNIGIPSFSINEFKVTTTQGEENPIIAIETDILVKRHAKISGKRLFLPLNIMDHKEKKLKKIDNRRTSVELKYGYIRSDTIHYQLPENFHPEFIPETTELETEFGSYRQEVIMNEDKITYIRRLTMKKGKHPPESYNRLVAFKNEIRSRDMVKMVLVNKT